MKSELDRICALVRECGATLRSIDRRRLKIDAKSGRANFVTECDRAVQARLQAGLRTLDPAAGFVGEESAADSPYSPQGRFWIVDPIDGTTNFIKDYRYSAISVALVADGRAELAAVYNPYADEMFTAARGAGARLNGERIAVSGAPLSSGLAIFGTSPYNEKLSRRSFRLAHAFFLRAMDVRRSGSAALDLCAVAAGRAELFFELQLAPWDHAAGGLIVEEAGGRLSDANGRRLAYDRPSSIVARGAGVDDTVLAEFSPRRAKRRRSPSA